MVTPVSAMGQAIISDMAAILALMLTLLSISPRLDRHLSRNFYKQVQLISLLSILDMIAASALMLALSTPIRSAARDSSMPVNWP